MSNEFEVADNSGTAAFVKYGDGRVVELAGDGEPTHIDQYILLGRIVDAATDLVHEINRLKKSADRKNAGVADELALAVQIINGDGTPTERKLAAALIVAACRPEPA